MSASNLSNTQFEQLDMFKTAKELRGMTLADVQANIWRSGGGLDYKKTAKTVMARKLRRAKQTGLYDSIKTEGVKQPVIVEHHPVSGKKVIEGHHRIASAMAINPNMLLPVRHDI